MSEPFDAVLLDLYDTIVWTEWFRLRDLIAARLGLDIQLLAKAFDVTRPARGAGAHPDARGDMAAVLEAAGVEPEPSLVEELLALERRELERAVHLYDDVMPVLRELRLRGVKTALISNCSHSTRPIVNRLGLEDAFDEVLLSYEVKWRKPDRAIYEMALDRLGHFDPAKALFVDDQPDYCDGAASVGMATRLMMRRGDRVPADSNGHQVVTDLRWLL